MSWILIVSWSVSVGAHTRAVAMQEFGSVEACQFASVEAKRIAPNLNAVCVPKGVSK